jgi:YD repeat-containing protein
MYKLLIILFCGLGFSVSSNAQFFHKDFTSNKLAKEELQVFKENKIRKVTLKSFDNDGTPTPGFKIERKIAKDYLSSALESQTQYSTYTVNNYFYSTEGLLTHSTDTSEISSGKYYYTYDENGRLWKTYSEITSFDDDYINTIKEEHIYFYNEDFYPDSMWLIRDKTDTTLILFSKDEVGNVAIEKDTKTGRKYYYYYDNKSRLTDIVHVHEYTQQLIPDYMFEYNQNGQIIQMITVEGKSNYMIWRYQYENGLKVKERCLDKHKKLLGYIEYEYK